MISGEIGGVSTETPPGSPAGLNPKELRLKDREQVWGMQEARCRNWAVPICLLGLLTAAGLFLVSEWSWGRPSDPTEQGHPQRPSFGRRQAWGCSQAEGTLDQRGRRLVAPTSARGTPNRDQMPPLPG